MRGANLESIRCRVLACEQRISINHTAFTKFLLGNQMETISAFAWEGSYSGRRQFSHGSPVHCTIRRRPLNGKTVADVYQCAEYEPLPGEAFFLLPASLFPSSAEQDRLAKTLNNLGTPLLLEFVQRFLLDFATSERFLTEPASLHYHHAYPGGLLVHSLECAEAINQVPNMDPMQKDLAVVAAFLHDAGKVAVFRNERRTALGHLVSHDALTLRVLHEPLTWLEDSWPDAAHALMHIWTCRNNKRWGYRPLSPVAHLVQMADRWSAEQNKAIQAFSTEEDWKNRAWFGEHECYWRPLPPITGDANRVEMEVSHG